MLDGETEKTGSLIKSVAPSAEALDIFIVKNDFQNLKAVLKSEKTGDDAEKYLEMCIRDSCRGRSRGL